MWWFIMIIIIAILALFGEATVEEWAEFEAWFWKIRPHLNVDWSIYNPPSKAETSGPTLPANPIVPVNENV
jgi:hypothetical protein